MTARRLPAVVVPSRLVYPCSTRVDRAHTRTDSEDRSNCFARTGGAGVRVLGRAIMGLFGLFGSDGDRIEADALPSGYDLVVLDCEGAEWEIVPEPEADRVVVETHGSMGSPTDGRIDRLEAQGYTIENVVIDDEDEDIAVVSATGGEGER